MIPVGAIAIGEGAEDGDERRRRFLSDRCTLLSDLDKLVRSYYFSSLCSSSEHCIGNGRYVKFNGTNRIVVARNHVVHTVWVAIGIDDTDNGDTEFVCLCDRNALVIYVDHKQHIGQARHLFDASDRALKLFLHSGAHQRFFLGQLGERPVSLLFLKLSESLDRGPNRFVIGEHPAEPAVADKRHPAPSGLLFDNFACGTLCAHKHDLIFLFGESLYGL